MKKIENLDKVLEVLKIRDIIKDKLSHIMIKEE
jgi:hypothetical protein